MSKLDAILDLFWERSQIAVAVGADPNAPEAKQQVKDLMLELVHEASFTAAKKPGFSQNNAYGGMDELRHVLNQKVSEL